MDSNSFLSIRTSANSGSILADTFNPTTPLMIEHLAMIFSNNLDRNTMSIARNGVGNDFSRSEFVDPLERYLLNSNSFNKNYSRELLYEELSGFENKI
eukprot:CAMPEP_0170066880 /NCGR_PEP_ID=MMETSP0019_2-20121128/6438_1 /TAXON_ID=98059 /ORGANISM="Dinobryon sp., Strain UTEXLB2267" /LENGTH=97 /DNA_ID=CAMNT_0010274133 /DNA_START=1139 /DNA_END=1432 /DNA_ORIENTATION=+